MTSSATKSSATKSQHSPNRYLADAVDATQAGVRRVLNAASTSVSKPIGNKPGPYGFVANSPSNKSTSSDSMLNERPILTLVAMLGIGVAIGILVRR
jgi:hypothetical protein